MTGRTHDAIAFASIVTVGAFYPPESINLLTLIGAVIAADIGATVPDMDGGANRLWHLLPAGEKTGKVLRRIFYKHRTLSHSILGTFAVYKFLEWLLPKFLNPEFIDPQLILISVMVGYISHLLADSMTEEGLPLLFPLKITFGIPPIKSLRIKTGKWFENFVVYPGVWVYLIFFIRSNQPSIISLLRLVK